MSGLNNLRPQRVVKAFERAGWRIERTTGSHVILSKPGSSYILFPFTRGSRSSRDSSAI
ncbi:MAG: type II toxin-antitoxin system HicA family toxin [Syntrophaceae bacterium]|nr:type II toxin-antitoxin system HicA family toxin [Syntrophaceae bacterium]